MPTKQQILEGIKKLTLFDDALFRKAAESKEFCEEIIRVFLEDPMLIVLANYSEKDFTNLQGRSVVLDLFCQLGDGRMVNVEVQKRNDKDHVRRVRFNSAIVTTNITDPGTKFENVPDLIIIYVTEFDVFNKGQVKYVVDSVLRGYGDIVNDGVVRIFINCANKDETEVSGENIQGEVIDG